jgi:hypothetical protein
MSTGGVPPSGGSGGAIVETRCTSNDRLIDDMEGDSIRTCQNGGWFIASEASDVDKILPHPFAYTAVEAGAPLPGHAARAWFDGPFTQQWMPNLACAPHWDAPYDASARGGISFYLKANVTCLSTVKGCGQVIVAVETAAAAVDNPDTTAVEGYCNPDVVDYCFAFHQKALDVTGNWSKHSISFDDPALQQTYGQPYTLDPGELTQIVFAATGSTDEVDQFEIWVDQLEWLN